MSHDHIVLGHGGGGALTRALLEAHILPRLTNPALAPLTDGAVLPAVSGALVLTTDAFVVTPLEFPGGDIGRLALCGTVNDLAMMGARPLGLSLALVLEEGLSLAVLDRVLDSLAAAAREAGVSVVTGDTKVVERGRGDGLLMTTAGVGERRAGVCLDARTIRPGDRLLVSGRLAEHGLAVMLARAGLGLTSQIKSDAAPLNGLVDALLAAVPSGLRFLRDPTRGGLAGVAADLVEATGLTLEIDERRLPISPMVRHAAEALGLDPLSVANEGKLVAVVAAAQAEALLLACRAHPLGQDAALVGRFVERKPALPELITALGGRRIIPRPYGEDLPRIC